MKNIKVAQKIFGLSLAIILIFTMVIGWVYLRARANLYEAKRVEVLHAVETAWGVVDHYAKEAAALNMSMEGAQEAAMEAIRHTRFDETNYFWINDLSPRMVMHPISPELNGKDLSGNKDPNGKALFVEMAQVAKEKGGGFVEYEWNKPGSEHPVPKISAVKLIPEWNWVIGAGLYLDDIEAELFAILWRVAVVVAAIILLALALVIFVARGISRPLGRAVHMIEEMEKGHLDTRLNLSQTDEIGRMAQAMDAFADSLQHEVVASLQQLASGDLTFQVTPRDDQDVVRNALAQVARDLNSILGQVQVAGEQIASGSAQVSDSSQSLSQGATESASSLEEITSSLTEMGSQTSLNAENASQANQLAAHARGAAEKGNAHMQAMVTAMGEINESGQNISKIIKVIDEIAFQTNLLALNAAVEAARAGQHGKGFAVVAEEVRNLAARSAKAAKETADLIEGSVKKAENGADIADKTAGALSEIVTGITKVTDLVAEIAAASNEQAQGLSQINQGLSQIDTVTQQNTASAEESAAAAEELSSQAEQLRQMLSRFMLAGKQSRFAPVEAPSTPAFLGYDKPSPPVKKTPPRSQAARPEPKAVIALDDAEFGRY
ncbi:methyl-accepting chemotaxis protein [Desulfuromonas sp. AOP6]|uniref:methyl-accepting chemotaxis protein n=1 Tax=Desulfuromonas sp. AOP6 TaxID=1566351 RepID=UPI001280DAD5|nr:methyl-accepting chemotaxis protein [Desulfuromonas sp. AOP6]BCA80771.1 methyl-accepting chemotaxis protein [Desulfuromonas sp. AOP6]